MTTETIAIKKRVTPLETMRHTAVIAERNLRRIIRLPQLLVFATIQPVMFVLLFAYVFGGAINIPGVNYIDFLIPGILVQTALFGATNTSIGLTEDLQSGIIDRFRSLPMARSAVLAGRTGSDAVRTLFVVLLMLVVGFLIGFRFHAGLLPAFGAIALAVIVGYSAAWVMAAIGLVAKTPEAAQAASFVLMFPFVFASSAFVPVETMPGWLQVFAENQPVTKFVDALRALILGGPTATPVFQALTWLVVILAIFIPLSVRQYRRSAE
ncbi:MAG: ABC transporter permease [Acidimicrobiia bacterium]|nr:MAG: ABC transporter permease [Acidimicrobiia bacterium]